MAQTDLPMDGIAHSGLGPPILITIFFKQCTTIHSVGGNSSIEVSSFQMCQVDGNQDLLWDDLSVGCEYIFLSLVNNKSCLTIITQDKIKRNKQTENSKQKGQNRERCQPTV